MMSTANRLLALALLAALPSFTSPPRQISDLETQLDAARGAFDDAIAAARKDYEVAVQAAATRCRKRLETLKPKLDGTTESFSALAKLALQLDECDQYSMGWKGMASCFIAPAIYNVIESGQMTATLKLRANGTFTSDRVDWAAESEGTWSFVDDLITLTWKNGTVVTGVLQLFTMDGDVVVRRKST